MSWHYQIRKRLNGTYDIVENFGKYGYTVDGMSPYGDTRAEIIRCLEMMLNDAKHFRTLVEKEQK